VLKKAWVVKLIIYPGPSNVDYGPGIELPQGTELTPLGRYVDFVKVQWTDEGGALQEGFVWVALLGDLPENLPELSKDEVPWIENPIFVSTHPMEFDNDTTDYHVYKVFGSAVEASEDVRTKVSMEVQSNNPDGSSGIGLSNGRWEGADFRRVGLYYQGGGWNLIYCAGDDYLIYERLPGLDAQEVKLNLMVDKEGQTVKVAKLNSQGGEEIIITRALSISLYGPTKTVGIDAQAGPTTNLYIDELLISQAPTGKYKEVGAASESLGDLARKANVTFGAATNPWNAAFDVGETNLLENHARVLLPMGDFMWENIHPEQNCYHFTLADMSLNFAYIHDMDIHIQQLFYHLALTDWIEQGNFSREQLISIMRDHTFTILDRYKERYPDKMIYVTVINEAVWAYQGYTGYSDSIFYRVLGPEWITVAYQLAAEATAGNTNLALLYNDYVCNEEEMITPGNKSRLVYDLVSNLRDAGIPVNFGVQAHTRVDKPFVKDGLKAILRDYAQVGDIVLNEIDVALVEGTDEELEEQARIYKDIISACIEVNAELGRSACRAMLLWGISDRESDEWRCAIFDADLNPKPAYFAIRDALRAAASQQ
jgi:endo-1,4-beta-xylanase